MSGGSLTDGAGEISVSNFEQGWPGSADLFGPLSTFLLGLFSMKETSSPLASSTFFTGWTSGRHFCGLCTLLDHVYGRCSLYSQPLSWDAGHCSLGGFPECDSHCWYCGSGLPEVSQSFHQLLPQKCTMYPWGWDLRHLLLGDCTNSGHPQLSGLPLRSNLLK